jgi:hypothetical protein
MISIYWAFLGHCPKQPWVKTSSPGILNPSPGFRFEGASSLKVNIRASRTGEFRTRIA